MTLFNKTGVSCFLSFILLIIPSVSFSDEVATSNQQFVHVVLLWLKEPGNIEHRQQFIKACRDFVDILGVLDIKIGQPVMSDRKIVDDSFDVALYVTVENKQALDNYLIHPIHINAVNIAKPIAERFLAYDFLDETVLD